MASSNTTIVRALNARRNEDEVLALNSLHGERVVARVRLVMFLLMGLTQAGPRWLFNETTRFDAIRVGTIVAYGLFCLQMIWIMERLAQPKVVLARYAPLMSTTVDLTFMVVMAWRTHAVSGEIGPEMSAASCAIIICFSVSRFGEFHVVYGTLAAITAFIIIGSNEGSLKPVHSAFVIGIYCSLGALMWATNRRVRRMFVDLRKRDNLMKFFPRQIAEKMVSMDGGMEPTQRVVTVLFSDIRSFTSFSETKAPREVLEFLDEYFGHMSSIVKAHDGVVNKFLGDGMLAFWGVPDKLPNHAELAIRAALDMRKKLVELNSHWAVLGKEQIRIGIGIHTGIVAAGMLGGADQHEYTVIGDAVNVASRVEGLTKGLGVDILLSQETYQALEGKFRCVRLAEEHVKGRAVPVVVWAVEQYIPSDQREERVPLAPPVA